MKKLIVYIFIITITAYSCSQQKNNSSPGAKTIDRNWLYSIIKASDSSYTKPYKRTDFVTAVYYINKKDSSVCQVMKDSADSIRQIIITKKDSRTFFAQYYANGNLQADLPLDDFGQYHCTGTFYYENGKMQSDLQLLDKKKKKYYLKEFFENGNMESEGGMQYYAELDNFMKEGTWKVYNEAGKLLSTQEFVRNQMTEEKKW